MLSLDLAEVSQCVLPGNNRNEIELQFPESDAVEANNDQLVSIRFYIPPDPDQDPGDRTVKTPAELLQQKIMSTASIRKTTGDVIVEFDHEKGSFLTPRGRYSIELCTYHTSILCAKRFRNLFLYLSSLTFCFYSAFQTISFSECVAKSTITKSNTTTYPGYSYCPNLTKCTWPLSLPWTNRSGKDSNDTNTWSYKHLRIRMKSL